MISLANKDCLLNLNAEMDALRLKSGYASNKRLLDGATPDGLIPVPNPNPNSGDEIEGDARGEDGTEFVVGVGRPNDDDVDGKELWMPGKRKFLALVEVLVVLLFDLEDSIEFVSMAEDIEEVDPDGLPGTRDGLEGATGGSQVSCCSRACMSAI